DKLLPTILTTSHKLSTGVDALNVRNIVLLRTISSIIEFKQIIGRGTRLFEGKNYFTVYDFVKAHHHFSDPEWDGDPIEPTPPEPSPPKGPRPPKDEPSEPRQKVVIKLPDGRERKI
ncbi:MAG: type I restriction endonuclease subunit R, partial [Candidatus Fonsibacter sp.]